MNFFIEDKGYSVLSGDYGYLCVHTHKTTDLRNVIDDVVGNMAFKDHQYARLCAIMLSESVDECSVIAMFRAFHIPKFKCLEQDQLKEILGESL